ncbi:hypothetical protein INS49_004600 [Diaporthe citri]|uniref:uncharacterized protein n=1 Tax=Diaporthe citri TaxID=83186 RepID=UPI001C81090F|nr:uncharacterized protein INS49_004600 [Diaporthe citri]KAG6354582.1 hypothetical protein INS49_004600 [Diaporthe citri]
MPGQRLDYSRYGPRGQSQRAVEGPRQRWCGLRRDTWAHGRVWLLAGTRVVEPYLGALEKVLWRRPGAEDGPEHARKTGIPPSSRRLSSMADSWRRGANNVHDLGPDLNPKLNVDLRVDPEHAHSEGT